MVQLFEQPPTQPPINPVICTHTKKPCDHATNLYQAVAQIRSAINRSVLIGAMIGAGIGTAAKDIIQGLL